MLYTTDHYAKKLSKNLLEMIYKARGVSEERVGSVGSPYSAFLKIT